MIKPLIALIKRKIHQYKRKKGFLKEIERRGGELERLINRRRRQSEIRRQKAHIIQGLIRSWDLGEIKRPPREEYDRLRFFYHGLTLKELQRIEKYYWS